MKPLINPKVSSLHQKWFRQIPKAEIVSEENFLAIEDPSCKEWVGVKALYSLAIRELKYHKSVDTYEDISFYDYEPVIVADSVKSRLLNIALQKTDLLSFYEIKVLNLLLENDRKTVASILGINKSRLSQIIKNIKTKITD